LREILLIPDPQSLTTQVKPHNNAVVQRAAFRVGYATIFLKWHKEDDMSLLSSRNTMAGFLVGCVAESVLQCTGLFAAPLAPEEAVRKANENLHTLSIEQQVSFVDAHNHEYPAQTSRRVREAR
jgi:hypothetical protein